MTHALTPLEIASGLVLGLDSPLEDRGPLRTPREALEDAIRPALERAPCLVSFSGGRDSSTVLAVAADLARREGLPPPVPATNRFRDAPGSDEAQWQERVVAHLGLDDWLRVEHGEELDCVGPVARSTLLRHGLLWPFNAHFHVPLLQAAQGGALLTGVGGDELLGVSALDRAGAVLRGRARPRRRDVARVAYALAPASLRRVALRRRLPAALPWLTPAAAAEFWGRWIADAAGDRRRWGARLRRAAARRDLRVGAASLERLGVDSDVRVVHPFATAGFALALARLPARSRYRTRTEATELLAGHLLPPDLLGRKTKAHFDEAFWRAPSREAAARWDGTGVDPEVVDAEALRREWAQERPMAQSFLLLQSVWLHGARRDSGAQRVEQPAGRLG